MKVFLSLGSNVRPEVHLPAAAASLAGRSCLLAVSRIYETPAVGAPDAPAFWNAAALIDTDLAPLALKLELLRPLEAEAGRVRTADRNAPRTLDLDLVLYGDLVLADLERGLVIPDPDLLRFAHVALPVAELDPDRPHPQTGEPLGEIARRLAAAAKGIQVRRERLLPDPGD
ncbi:MAG TPA: 2-amino-4-hydroxy-6-hydroxymethyldihydropteridine diphosphokinase [Thermoanaerobaculia bacterium]|nr:2-amino-4-hydroxy-6-hydroxymethyldihydropteridine diphosphokinase [Thermoanaerobaculia bacterium]